MPKVVAFERPKPKKPRAPRKRPDEWRLMRYASKVKDGRPVLLAFDDEDRPGDHIVRECYWHQVAGDWFFANTTPEAGFEPASMVLGDPETWRPMPSPANVAKAKTPAKRRNTKPRQSAARLP